MHTILIFGGGGVYEPFKGILLGDTFQLGEKKGETLDAFVENVERAEKQNKRNIRVIVGNPPYSAKQKNENDSNKNIQYPILDQRITETYAKHSVATHKTSLYDSYIRSIRWASDRIGDEGIIAFVSNGSYIDGNAADGLRKCLSDEFSSIYCFNLRGNIRKNMQNKNSGEGGNVFGGATMVGIAITLFVKKPMAKDKKCVIHYYDIGDNLNQKEKLKEIKTLTSVKNIEYWQNIKPNDQHDWINQRHPEFAVFLPIGDISNKQRVNSVASIFSLYSGGVKTNRDSWVYNFSKEKLGKNMKSMIDFYNREIDRYRKTSIFNIDQFVNNDSTKIDWDGTLKMCLGKAQNGVYSNKNIRCSIYRPFTKQWLYFDRQFNNSIYRMFDFFPTSDSGNLAIYITGKGSQKFSAFMVDSLPDLQIAFNGQCFPFYSYEKSNKDKGLDFGRSGRIENISDATLATFRGHYHDQKISKWDIFYYVYGLLHSQEYKIKYTNDLTKMLPRIPMHAQFHVFSEAGKALGKLHINYEDAPEYPLQEISKDLIDTVNRKAEKMKFVIKDKEKDKTVIVYNNNLDLSGVPLEAYNYVVNGRSAIEWVMNSYQIKEHKKSKIINDPNKWSDDPDYIIKLLKKVVYVSVESVKIIESLPELDR